MQVNLSKEGAFDVQLAVIGAHVYIPAGWNADEDADSAWSAPTSYYAAVQVRGEAELIGDPIRLSELMNRQMQHFQLEGGYHEITPDSSPFGRMLVAIRGIRLKICSIDAKFRFGGNRSTEHRKCVAHRLGERDAILDKQAMLELLRRDKLHAV